MHYFEINPEQKLTSRWSFFALAALVLVVSGCAVTPPSPAPQPAPAVQSLEQYMQEAKQAATEGSKERARDTYRTAAKTYPTNKEPWLKLAEDYFEASNYGQAILASQEVLQRDPADSVATSVLAVSGLRVSASALSMLRQQQSMLNGGARSEAEDLAKVLRDVLGEPVLVPSAMPAAVTKPGPSPSRRATPVRPAATGAAAAAATAAASAPPSTLPASPKPAPSKAALPPKTDVSPANPFDALKK